MMSGLSPDMLSAHLKSKSFSTPACPSIRVRGIIRCIRVHVSHAEINCLYGIPFEFPCLGILHQRIFAGGLILCNHIVVAMPTLGVIARRINQQAHPAVGCFKRCERLHGLYIEIIEVRILSNLRTDYIVGLTLQSLGGLHRFGSIDAILFVITEFHSLGIPLREIALQCYRKGLLWVRGFCSHHGICARSTPIAGNSYPLPTGGRSAQDRAGNSGLYTSTK